MSLTKFEDNTYKVFYVQSITETDYKHPETDKTWDWWTYDKSKAVVTREKTTYVYDSFTTTLQGLNATFKLGCNNADEVVAKMKPCANLDTLRIVNRKFDKIRLTYDYHCDDDNDDAVSDEEENRRRELHTETTVVAREIVAIGLDSTAVVGPYAAKGVFPKSIANPDGPRPLGIPDMTYSEIAAELDAPSWICNNFY